MTSAPIAHALATDELDALRGPIMGYCYRMLGSPHEAEDAVQETMIRAWRSVGGLESLSGLRPWLFRIATNVCIDALNDRGRRAMPMDLGAPDDGHGDLGTALPEATWVQPIPTRLLGLDDPAERAVSRETIRLAFIAALQHLLPRQRAVLILRDVLRWHASEVAELLDTSVPAVHSSLRRARAVLAKAQHGDGLVPCGPVDSRLLEQYIDAFERVDIDAIVSLLHRDAVVSMPPYAFWMRGRDAFHRWLKETGSSCTHPYLVVAEANGQPAIGFYRRGGTGDLEPFAIHIVEWQREKVVGLHAFLEPALFVLLGLPDRIEASPIRPRVTVRRPVSERPRVRGGPVGQAAQGRRGTTGFLRRNEEP